MPSGLRRLVHRSAWRRSGRRRHVSRLRRSRQKASATLKQRLAPFNGLCWWCLRAGHDPARCDARPQPSMKDFERQRPAKTRGRTKNPKSQTTLSVVEAAKRRKAYNIARVERTRELEARAKERALETIKRRTAPLLGWGPLGSFTTMQLLAIEFAVGLEQHLTTEQRAKDTASIDRAALQLFTRLVKAMPEGTSSSPFRSLDDFRASSYDKPFTALDAETSFFLLHERAMAQWDDVCALLALHRQGAKRLHPHCPEVQALSDQASLLTILQVAAAKPPRGRPAKGAVAASPGAGFYEAADNWADGGYKTEAMEARTIVREPFNRSAPGRACSETHTSSRDLQHRRTC